MYCEKLGGRRHEYLPEDSDLLSFRDRSRITSLDIENYRVNQQTEAPTGFDTLTNEATFVSQATHDGERDTFAERDDVTSFWGRFTTLH